MMPASALLLSFIVSQAAASKPRTELTQDITVRARAAAMTVQVAPPTASKPIVDEVLASLAFGRGLAAGPERFRAGGDMSRLLRPFPEPPFLVLSPANIKALYDEWTFEIVDSKSSVVWSSDGVGALTGRLEWDGTGNDAQPAIVTGRSYQYRFTGRRAGRSFVVESDPALINSFSHHEYGGETLLEADAGLLFIEGKSAWKVESKRWIDAFVGRLLTSEPRPDGTYKVALHVRNTHDKLASSRAKALTLRLASALLVESDRIVMTIAKSPRGETVSVFLPPSKGASVRDD
ncbi:MAG: hypothetical protein AAB036_01820 [Elusimicrobiota bacterium]|mgnify:CR=1 FL=1